MDVRSEELLTLSPRGASPGGRPAMSRAEDEPRTEGIHAARGNEPRCSRPRASPGARARDHAPYAIDARGGGRGGNTRGATDARRPVSPRARDLGCTDAPAGHTVSSSAHLHLRTGFFAAVGRTSRADEEFDLVARSSVAAHIWSRDGGRGGGAAGGAGGASSDGRDGDAVRLVHGDRAPRPEPASERAVRPHRASSRPSLFPSPRRDESQSKRDCPVPLRSTTDASDRPSPPPSSLAQASDETAADAAPPADAPEDPVTTSMTISYALPDGTEHASSAPCPVTRERAGAVPLEWSGPDAGHAPTIDETLLRARLRPARRRHLHPRGRLRRSRHRRTRRGHAPT